MKKVCLVFVLAILSGFIINCNQAPPQQNAFRLKTRVKFRLFGFIPLFGIPAPLQQINLKTNLTPNAPGTTGTKPEFNPNGTFVATDAVGKFDAVDAILPATWTVKVNPNQPIRYPCMYPATMSFQAQGSQTYKYKCEIDIVNSIVSAPNHLSVNVNGTPSTGTNPINWGIKIGSSNGKAFFSNAQNLRVSYYRLTGFDTTNGDNEAIYQLESVDTPDSISPNGAELTTEYPIGWHGRSGFLLGGTIKEYHVVISEGGVYLAHATFSISYPEHNCDPRTRIC